MNQMTIFDVMGPRMDFRKMTDEEMVRLIGEMTGLEFRWNDFFKQYIARDKALTVKVCRDRYIVDDGLVEQGQEFISTQVDSKRGGCGSPCDSLIEAAEFIKAGMRRLKTREDE